MNDIMHTNNTIAFVYAQAHIESSSSILLDASHVIPCPGDPQHDSYEDSVPDLPNPFVIALSHVNGKASHLPNGSWVFPFAISKYVWDTVQLSMSGSCTISPFVIQLNCSYCSVIFNSACPHWKNTNVPTFCLIF
jgi:hypothetical protein